MSKNVKDCNYLKALIIGYFSGYFSEDREKLNDLDLVVKVEFDDFYKEFKFSIGYTTGYKVNYVKVEEYLPSVEEVSETGSDSINFALAERSIETKLINELDKKIAPVLYDFNIEYE